jgi:hypothetical protein
MTMVQGFDGEDAGLLPAIHDPVPAPAPDDGVDDAMFDLGGDERRMHVRAYNHWVSLLGGRPFPPIAELDPARIADFGEHSVLLDFSHGIEDPRIAFLGRTLREECDLPPEIGRVADVPSRSLLSRLTDHYLQIIANRAPIGFEAEFIGTRGRTTMYRGILMPFSSNDETIDFIYGVINWKEVADVVTQASLDAELAASLRGAPPAIAARAAVWADGPLGEVDADDAEATIPADLAGSLARSLDDRLMVARESAAAVRAADTRSRSALYRALGRAHDFALAAAEDRAGYDALLAQAGLVEQARAPMTPVVKLVFGADYDKTRVAEFAAVLGQAAAERVPAGALATWLDGVEGGIKAVVATARATRRPEKVDPMAAAAETLRTAPAIATVDLPADGAEFVVLLARANADGTLDIVARADHRPLVEAAIKRVA